MIVANASPVLLTRGEPLTISVRLFRRGSFELYPVSRVFMTISSVTDGRTVWPLEVIRHDTAGFDISIGTSELKEGHRYIIRVSNNWNLSPSASAFFEVRATAFPVVALLPLALSPLFMRKYGDLAGTIRTPGDLIPYLRRQGWSEARINEEINRIVRDMEGGPHPPGTEAPRLPIDPAKEPVTMRWVTQVDHRVCPLCEAASRSGPEGNGLWPWNDPDAPEIPRHPNCRCHWDVTYRTDRTPEFRAMAMAALPAAAVANSTRIIGPGGVP